MEHKMISIADQVFERLEMDILSGVYERDEILTESRLSEQLGVSRTPIREAVRRLDQEHLVDLTSKGIRVVGISRQDIADISEIRLRLEGLAARWAAERATEEDIRALREIVELQEFYTAAAATPCGTPWSPCTASSSNTAACPSPPRAAPSSLWPSTAPSAKPSPPTTARKPSA